MIKIVIMKRPLSAPVKEFVEVLCTNIRIARRERGWTQDELAQRLGISRVSLGKLERGDASLGLGVVLEAAFLCGLPIFAESERARAQLRGLDQFLPARIHPPKVLSDDF